MTVQNLIVLNYIMFIKVLLDGAQAVSHMRVNIQDLNCDWYVFSAHKYLGQPVLACCMVKKL